MKQTSKKTIATHHTSHNFTETNNLLKPQCKFNENSLRMRVDAETHM